MATSPRNQKIETHLAFFLDDHNVRAEAIRTTDPTPSEPQWARGSLYVLIEMMGDSPVKTKVLRQLHDQIQDTYYTAGGSVSTILEQGINEAHEILRQVNLRSPSTDLRAGILSVAIVQGHLVLASAGPGLALISTDRRLDQFPPGPSHYTSPLGGEIAPQISFYRHRIKGGDTIFLGESDWILLTNVKTMGGAIANASKENRFDVVDYLRRQSNSAEILGMLIVAEEPQPVQRRSSRGSLPTALGATPPVRSVPESASGASSGMGSGTRRGEGSVPASVGQSSSGQSSPAPSSGQRSVAQSSTGQSPTGQSSTAQRSSQRVDPNRPVDSSSSRSAVPGGAGYDGSPSGTPVQRVSQENVRVYGPGEQVPKRSWFERVPIFLAGASSQGSRLFERVSASVSNVVGNVLPDKSRGAVAPPDWVGSLPDLSDASDADSVQSGQVQPGQNRELSPPLFTPPEKTKGGRARLFILLALLIPLIAFATVGAVYLQRGSANQTEGLKLVELAESQLYRAQQALGLGDESTARVALGEAQRYLNEAIALIGLNDRIREIANEIQTELQGLLQVRYLYSLDFPLIQFPPNASPHRVVVFDQDVYVLDSGRQIVEAFRMDASRTLLQESVGVIIQEGDVVQGVTVGRIVDISWQPRIAGFSDIASLLILDRNNNVFRYNPIDETTHLRLGEEANLQGLSQIASYSGRLYLVDEQANQIWRYAPAGAGYDQAPDPWFAPEIQANLAGVVSMMIDGDIWLLIEDGTILRYRQGQQSPFSLENTAGLTGRMVDMAATSASDGRIYLADGNLNRILVFTKDGTYVEQFQAAEADTLQGLRGLYLDEVTGTLYILTQNSLFVHALPE